MVVCEECNVAKEPFERRAGSCFLHCGSLVKNDRYFHFSSFSLPPQQESQAIVPWRPGLFIPTAGTDSIRVFYGKKKKKKREREIARLVCLFVLEGFGSARKC